MIDEAQDFLKEVEPMQPPARVMNNEFCSAIQKDRDRIIRLVSLYYTDVLEKIPEMRLTRPVKVDLFAGTLFLAYQIHANGNDHTFTWKAREQDLLADPRSVVEILREQLDNAIRELDDRPGMSNFDVSPF
jgi:hypothetical protein